MQETKNINLAGIAFVIDVDAADRLSQYLQRIEAHLEASDSKDEIMQDIEARIAELFKQHLSYSHAEVVNMRMVADVMEQLGSPELITSTEDEANENENQNPNDVQGANANENENNVSSICKKLYRDLDNQRIAGVCSGVATYLNIDAVWLRLLLVLSVLFYGCGIFLYLILWLVIPAANTTARKLEQQGIDPSAENIRQEVERQKEYQATHPSAQRKSSGVGAFGGCLIALGLICLFPFLIAFCVVLFALIMALFGVSVAAGPIVSLLGISSGSVLGGVGCAICGLLLFIIPLVAVIIWSRHNNRSEKPLSKWFWIVALVLWLLALVGANYGGYRMHKVAEDWDSKSFEMRMDSLGVSINKWGHDMEAWADSVEQYADSIEASAGVLEVGE